ncbi:hypothetical protein, partial [Hallella sp.]|uniref:hypothetical protein n=1 Tax=Hallella sp. TaxID=2980186 RepID=UPI003078E6D8
PELLDVMRTSNHSKCRMSHFCLFPTPYFTRFGSPKRLILHGLPQQISENCLMKAILAYPKQ